MVKDINAEMVKLEKAATPQGPKTPGHKGPPPQVKTAAAGMIRLAKGAVGDVSGKTSGKQMEAWRRVLAGDIMRITEEAAEGMITSARARRAAEVVRTIQGMVAQLQEGWRTEARTEMMRRVEEENAEKWKGSVWSMWQATEQIWEINEHGRRRPRDEMQKEREQEASRQANVQDGAPAASHRRAPRQTEREGAGLRGITRSKSRRRQAQRPETRRMDDGESNHSI